MTTIPVYDELSIPLDLLPFFSRIMYIEYDEDQQVDIPARPTGRMYFGWFAEGCGSARANGQLFSIKQGEAHVSGQLTVFDAQYSLKNKAKHFLAECTPLGAFRMLGKDLGTYTNRCHTFDPKISLEDGFDGFCKFLYGITDSVTSVDPNIERAIDRIDSVFGDINIRELAMEIGISSRQLRREFTKCVGIAPKPYALIRKVLFALQSMTINPDVRISDVVHSAGFYDQAHFTKVFQLYIRTSPKNLRLNEDGVLRSIVSNI